MHGLLKRQLRRYFGDSFAVPDEWRQFVEAVNDAYEGFDADRSLMERSLDLSSQELLSANSQMRAVFQAIPDLLFRLDRDGTILEFKAGGLTDFYLKPGELLGKRIQDVPLIEVKDKFREAISQVHEKKGTVSIEYELDLQDRRNFYEARLVPFLEDQIIVIVRNITERKLAEEELRRSEERYRNILDSMEEAYYEVDLKGNIVFLNPAVARMIGYTEKDLLGRNFREFMEEETSHRVYEAFHRVYLTGESTKLFDWEFITASGDILVVEASAYLNRDAKGDPVGFKGIGRDVTQRKRSDEALRRSEAKYRFLTEKTNDVIWTSDLGINITFVSSSVEKVLGYTPDEFMKRNTSELMTPESFAHAMDLLGAEIRRERDGGADPERTVKVDLEFLHKNGTTVWVENLMSAIRDDSGRFVGIHGVSRDITERKRAEEEKKKLETQLAQAQKMESIGTLAGGIAHDFNNILSAIIGYAELALADVLKPEKAMAELGEILKAGDRAKDLVSQILTFSRQTETRRSPLMLPSVIKESLRMLRSIIPSTIALRSDLVDSGLILSDPTQINQIMLNLCTNAVHAMDTTGGVLEVALKRVHIHEGAAPHESDLPPGPYLRLSVSDTGHGMPMEVMERIFDPYFTTKEVGRGTGLGLAVVHGIVKSNGGAIACTSSPGKGTTFEVYLPELEPAKEHLKTPEMEPIPTGTERILFVDDEPVLVDLAKKMIENLGYTVFVRTSSIEAFEFFRNSPDKFDLVISDMTMPGMTGDRLAQKIMTIRHDIPIILCTGYSEHITEERAKSIGVRRFVMKPLVMRELAITIRSVLDEQKR